MVGCLPVCLEKWCAWCAGNPKVPAPASSSKTRIQQIRWKGHVFSWIGDTQCCGSVTFWYRAGSRSCYFRRWPSRRQQKFFFAYYFLKLNLHNFSKIKSHKEVTKQWKSTFFLLFLHDDRIIRILPESRSQIRTSYYRIRLKNLMIRSIFDTEGGGGMETKNKPPFCSWGGGGGVSEWEIIQYDAICHPLSAD